MFSLRFKLRVVVTVHARQRMRERNLTDALLMEIIDTGVDKDAGAGHHWLYKHLADRDDNLLCAAVVLENALIVKTVMHHWEPTP